MGWTWLDYEFPYIALVFESEHKAKSSGSSRTKFDGICEARRIVPNWIITTVIKNMISFTRIV